MRTGGGGSEVVRPPPLPQQQVPLRAPLLPSFAGPDAGGEAPAGWAPPAAPRAACLSPRRLASFAPTSGSIPPAHPAPPSQQQRLLAAAPDAAAGEPHSSRRSGLSPFAAPTVPALHAPCISPTLRRRSDVLLARVSLSPGPATAAGGGSGEQEVGLSSGGGGAASAAARAAAAAAALFGTGVAVDTLAGAGYAPRRARSAFSPVSFAAVAPSPVPLRAVAASTPVGATMCGPTAAGGGSCVEDMAAWLLVLLGSPDEEASGDPAAETTAARRRGVQPSAEGMADAAVHFEEASLNLGGAAAAAVPDAHRWWGHSATSTPAREAAAEEGWRRQEPAAASPHTATGGLWDWRGRLHGAAWGSPPLPSSQSPGSGAAAALATPRAAARMGRGG